MRCKMKLCDGKKWIRCMLMLVMITQISSCGRTEEQNKRMQENSYIEQSSQEDKAITKGRWIYYGDVMSERLSEEDQAYLKENTTKWTNGQLSDNELSEWIAQRLAGSGIRIRTVAALSRQICLFDSEEELPDYDARLREAGSIYDFVGVYTDGEKNENGKLICYYWEAGVR